MKKVLCAILALCLLCLSGCAKSQTLEKWAIDYIEESLEDGETITFVRDIDKTIIDTINQLQIEVILKEKGNAYGYICRYYVTIELNISKLERGFRNFFGGNSFEQREIKSVKIERLKVV